MTTNKSQSKQEYIPTLLEYAQVIEWMADHPKIIEGMPPTIQKPFRDAVQRLYRMAIIMEMAIIIENSYEEREEA
jgi:hypothetical protein